jgi:CheY-like chemotaxis protein
MEWEPAASRSDQLRPLFTKRVASDRASSHGKNVGGWGSCCMDSTSESDRLATGELRSPSIFIPPEEDLIRIFVVDDSVIFRTQIRALLEGQPGWAVVGEAVNGRHAVDTFHEHMPHVTVMDFVMPEMDGLEAARRLIRRDPAIIILIVTADPLRQLIEDAKRAGVKGVCPKSKPDCLLKAIETLINGGTHFHQESAVA